jgi:hypothetical protein
MNVERRLALKTRKFFNDLHSDIPSWNHANRTQVGKPIEYLKKTIEDAIANGNKVEVELSMGLIADMQGLFVRLVDRKIFSGGHWLADSVSELLEKWNEAYQNQLVP